MKKHTIGHLVKGTACATLAGVAILTFLAVPLKASKSAPPRLDPPTVGELLDSIKDSRLKRIMTELGACESGHDPKAVNPEDLDGTPSLGWYQFKPSTLYEEGKRYKILNDIEPNEIENIIFDTQTQFSVAFAMIADRGTQRSFWQSQFPGCGNKYRFWEY